MVSKQLSVPEIHCGHCKMSIEGAVGGLSGVTKVEVDIEARSVAVDFDETALDLAAVIDAIESQGYEVPSA